MTQSFNVAEAKKRFSDLLGRVAFGGESFVITRRGRPMARLAPLTAASSSTEYPPASGANPFESTDEQPGTLSEPAAAPYDDLARRFGLSQAGDQVLLEIDSAGELRISRPGEGDGLGRIPGLLRHRARAQPVTLEEMDRAIGDELAARHQSVLGTS